MTLYHDYVKLIINISDGQYPIAAYRTADLRTSVQCKNLCRLYPSPRILTHK